MNNVAISVTQLEDAAQNTSAAPKRNKLAESSQVVYVDSSPSPIMENNGKEEYKNSLISAF